MGSLSDRSSFQANDRHTSSDFRLLKFEMQPAKAKTATKRWASLAIRQGRPEAANTRSGTFWYNIAGRATARHLRPDGRRTRRQSLRVVGDGRRTVWGSDCLSAFWQSCPGPALR